MIRAVYPLGARCPGCGGRDVQEVLQQRGLPASCHHLCAAREDALRVSRGDLDLVACVTCGLLYNRRFDPALLVYQAGYENSLHFSPRFREYLDELAGELTATLDLHGKKIVEIGCGDGMFLAMLCQRGGNRGYGFDPAGVDATIGNVRLAARPFAEQDAEHGCDLICMRHVLEHLTDPAQLLQLARRSLKSPSGAVYLEVPNGDYMLRTGSVWDLLYEHCLYFTHASLEQLLRRCGFEDVELRERFGGQFLTAVARPGEPAIGNTDQRSATRQPATNQSPMNQSPVNQPAISEFGALHRNALQQAEDRLLGHCSQGRQVAIWGAGTKGIMLMNTVDAARRITAVIDVNPRKCGSHIPGVGIRISAPDEPVVGTLDAVAVTNAMYTAEIRERLAARGCYPDLITL